MWENIYFLQNLLIFSHWSIDVVIYIKFKKKSCGIQIWALVNGRFRGEQTYMKEQMRWEMGDYRSLPLVHLLPVSRVGP